MLDDFVLANGQRLVQMGWTFEDGYEDVWTDGAGNWWPIDADGYPIDETGARLEGRFEPTTQVRRSHV